MKNETRDALLRIWCKGVVQFDDVCALVDAGEIDIVGDVADFTNLGRFEVKVLIGEGVLKAATAAQAIEAKVAEIFLCAETGALMSQASELLREGSPELRPL